MGAAAPVVGSIITAVVVGSVASKVAEKIGFSESTAQILGLAAGAYAGGMVGGGSTAASTQQAGATTSIVGTQLPTGYGGPVSPTGSGFTGTGPQVATTVPAGQAVSGTAYSPAAGGGAGAAAAGSGFPAGGLPAFQPQMAAPAPTFQAPTTVQQTGTVGVPGATTAGTGTTPAPVTPAEQGYLSQGMQRQPVSGTYTQPGSRTAEGIIKQETVGRTPGGSDAQSSWLERFFSPEKTMDLAIAGIGGYAEAGMRKWELEYPEKVKRRDAADWARAFPGMASLNQQYPSGYGGP